MAPVLQGFVAFAILILLGLFLLSKMAFAIAHNLSHMAEIFFVISRFVFFRVLLQNLNDLASTGQVISVCLFIRYLYGCLACLS